MWAMDEQPHRTPASVLTPADYALYREHLDELRRVRDHDLPELLRDARGFVSSDAEEEMAQIREDHVYVAARITHLEALLRDAHILADSEAPGIAVPGRIVDVEYTDRGTLATYRIAGAGGSDGVPTVSPASPVGQALIGRPAGAVVSVELPRGRATELRILAVRPGDERLAAA
jgi:transcription elongation factor GreA